VTTAQQWITAYAAALGTEPPDPAETDTLLAVAGVAAHASERVAAPLSTWLAGRAGVDPARAQQIALDVAAQLEAQEPGDGSAGDDGGRGGGGAT
jgi:Domain of unknown function (DUF6457)